MGALLETEKLIRCEMCSLLSSWEKRNLEGKVVKDMAGNER